MIAGDVEEISLSLYDMNTGEDITANVCGLMVLEGLILMEKNR